MAKKALGFYRTTVSLDQDNPQEATVESNFSSLISVYYTPYQESSSTKSTISLTMTDERAPILVDPQAKFLGDKIIESSMAIISYL